MAMEQISTGLIICGTKPPPYFPRRLQRDGFWIKLRSVSGMCSIGTSHQHVPNTPTNAATEYIAILYSIMRLLSFEEQESVKDTTYRIEG